jgi:hypothetical protein
MKTLEFGPAVGGDVAIRNGQVHLTYGHQPWVHLLLSLDGEILARHTQPTAYYPKTNGEICIGHDGARFLSWSPPSDLAIVHPGAPVGNNATGVSPKGILFFAKKISDVASGFFRGDTRLANAWASNGIWEANDDGSIKTFDECF